MQNFKDQPVYTIGIAARLLGACQATLRIWERQGLISPSRLGKNRFYSYCDIQKLKEIKKLLQQKHLNIAGVKNFVRHLCWDIKKCSLKERRACPVYSRYKVFAQNQCC